MRRVVTPENLDLRDYPASEIAVAFADMDRVNRWLGGYRTTRKLLERLAGLGTGQPITVLDVAAGGGDVSTAMQKYFAGRGVRVEVTLLDRKLAHLQNSTVRGSSSMRRVVADALALPFRDSSFDVVSCSLFAHHLEPDALQMFVREAMRVCRAGVAVNDLRRSALALGLFVPTLLFFRSRVAWQDGVRSVRRAYTVEEMRSILSGCGGQVEIARRYAFRFGAIVWKQERAKPAIKLQS